MSTIAYGTAIVSRKKGTIRDFEVAGSEEEAVTLADENNKRLERLGVQRKIRWRVARIELMPEQDDTDSDAVAGTDQQTGTPS